MKHTQSSIIMGTAIGVAAIAVVVDHTKHRLPEPETQLASQEAVIILEEGEDMPSEIEECGKPASSGRPPSPCSL